ncbi:MAG: restriction endonuclease subunit S, partial [Rhodoglobus sp.]
MPEAWEEAVLASVATIQTGVAKGRKFAAADMIEVPYLRVANVQDGHLDLSKMKKITIRRNELERYRLQDGDVVLTEGGDFDKLGRGFTWRSELDLCVHQNHVFAVRPERSRLLPDFFAYLAQSPYGKAYFLHVAHKTTNLACINTTKLKAFPVILPPLEEQREIVEILEALDRNIDLHQQKRAVLDEVCSSL